MALESAMADALGSFLSPPSLSSVLPLSPSVGFLWDGMILTPVTSAPFVVSVRR